MQSSLILSLAATVVLATNSRAAALKPGDIVVADSQAAVLRIDPVTHAATVIASGGKLVRPFGVAVDVDGTILVADTGALAIIRINPATSEQTIVSSGGILGAPYGIAIDRNGYILAVNAAAIIRINPATGDQKVFSTGGLTVPVGVAVSRNGAIYVADMAPPGQVVRINPVTGDPITAYKGAISSAWSASRFRATRFWWPIRMRSAEAAASFRSTHSVEPRPRSPQAVISTRP